ncbi:MAG: hypothetical protein AB8G96_05645 [Phycisphaerales bacterium]
MNAAGPPPGPDAEPDPDSNPASKPESKPESSPRADDHAPDSDQPEDAGNAHGADDGLPLDTEPVAGGEVVLRAKFGAPLADHAIRDLVAATALAIGERHGVPVEVLMTDDESIGLRVGGGDLVAIGLAAELRRLTDRWHHRRYGTPLWRAPWEPDDAG